MTESRDTLLRMLQVAWERQERERHSLATGTSGAISVAVVTGSALSVLAYRSGADLSDLSQTLRESWPLLAAVLSWLLSLVGLVFWLTGQRIHVLPKGTEILADFERNRKFYLDAEGAGEIEPEWTDVLLAEQLKANYSAILAGGVDLETKSNLARIAARRWAILFMVLSICFTLLTGYLDLYKGAP